MPILVVAEGEFSCWYLAKRVNVQVRGWRRYWTNNRAKAEEFISDSHAELAAAFKMDQVPNQYEISVVEVM